MNQIMFVLTAIFGGFAAPKYKVLPIHPILLQCFQKTKGGNFVENTQVLKDEKGNNIQLADKKNATVISQLMSYTIAFIQQAMGETATYQMAIDAITKLKALLTKQLANEDLKLAPNTLSPGFLALLNSTPKEGEVKLNDPAQYSNATIALSINALCYYWQLDEASRTKIDGKVESSEMGATTFIQEVTEMVIEAWEYQRLEEEEAAKAAATQTAPAQEIPATEPVVQTSEVAIPQVAMEGAPTMKVFKAMVNVLKVSDEASAFAGEQARISLAQTQAALDQMGKIQAARSVLLEEAMAAFSDQLQEA